MTTAAAPTAPATPLPQILTPDPVAAWLKTKAPDTIVATNNPRSMNCVVARYLNETYPREHGWTVSYIHACNDAAVIAISLELQAWIARMDRELDLLDQNNHVTAGRALELKP